MSGVEFRICWAASSNATFRGSSDWMPWEDDGDPEDVLTTNEATGPYNAPPGLEMALDHSGFEWWVETR